MPSSQLIGEHKPIRIQNINKIWENMCEQSISASFSWPFDTIKVWGYIHPPPPKAFDLYACENDINYGVQIM